MNSPKTGFLTILTTLAFLGFTVPAFAAKPDCDDPSSTHPKCNPDSGGDGGPLCVTFDDSSINKFRSDSLGEYCDGSGDGVNTGIDKFRFGLNVGLSGPRDFILDLSQCAPDAVCPTPPIVLTRGWNVFSFSPDGAQFLKMAKDTPQDVNFQLEFLDAEGRGWSIQFNPGDCPMDASDNPLSTPAKVTKTSDNPDTWVFETSLGDVACLQLREGGKKHWTFHGLYIVPFKITAVAQ